MTAAPGALSGAGGARAETSAGLQPRALLRRRRLGFHAFHLALSAGALALSGAALAPGGLGAAEAALLLCLAIGGGYAAFDAANALLSLWLLATRRDPVAAAAPYAPAARADQSPLRERVAVAVCARNEAPGPILERLARLRAELGAAGAEIAFFYLSDSDDPARIQEEEAAFAAGLEGVRYRRRGSNAGFKAGNLQDFAEKEGRAVDLVCVLDADGAIGGEALLSCCRAMRRHPRIAVLQTLILPFPGEGLFDRAFRFGVRASVKTHYLGRAFWQGDVGAYGGHGALIRLEALRAHGRLPPIPGPPPLGGAVLGHDHAEAMRMHGAGWEIRLWPEECASFEHHPPTLLDYAARERRWSRGAMQYLYLALAGGWPEGARLSAAERFHLLQFAWQHLAAPAFILGLGLSALIAGGAPESVDATLAAALAAGGAALAATPRLVGHLDQATIPGRVRALGGAGAFLRNVALDLGLTALFAPVAFFETTRGLIGLLADRIAGRPLGWAGQARAARLIALGTAARALWPASLFGLLVALGFAAAGPAALFWSAPAWLGLILAIPLAALTSAPERGRGLGPRRLALPEI